MYRFWYVCGAVFFVGMVLDIVIRPNWMTISFFSITGLLCLFIGRFIKFVEERRK